MNIQHKEQYDDARWKKFEKKEMVFHDSWPYFSIARKWIYLYAWTTTIPFGIFTKYQSINTLITLSRFGKWIQAPASICTTKYRFRKYNAIHAFEWTYLSVYEQFLPTYTHIKMDRFGLPKFKLNPMWWALLQFHFDS